MISAYSLNPRVAVNITSETLFLLYFFFEMCPVTTTLFQPAGEGGKAVRTAGGGRQAKYHTADDKAAAQRHNAILHYHRKRALQKRQSASIIL